MYIDDRSGFGTYKPKKIVTVIIKITRSIGQSWIAKRVIFLLRRIALLFSKECVDTSLFNCKMRLYTKGNVCEKRALFAPQIFESYERDFICKNAKDVSTFIDIGSNVGLYSLSVGDSYKSFKETKIHSIEPHPKLFKRLLYNSSLNPNIPIKTHNFAIMDKNEEFYLNVDEDNLGQSTVSDSGKINVEGKTLENFIHDQNIKKITTLKVDVEGNEEKVILPFLKEENRELFPEIIIIENNKLSWDKDLIELLVNFGYSLNKKTRMNYILTLHK